MLHFQQAEFLASYGLLKQIPPSDGVEIAFAGRSNVGKSSLINRLLNRKGIARVSSSPGKTTTINFYQVDGLHLCDLPGYGYAKVAKTEKQRWSELMEGYFAADRNLALVVQLVDIRHEPTALDRQMIEFLAENEFPFLIALTKADKLKPSQKKRRLEELKDEIPYGDQLHMIAVSAETGEGIEQLREILTEVYEDASDAVEPDNE